MSVRLDFTALPAGGLPELAQAAGGEWSLAPVARHPRNVSARPALASPDYHVAFPGICRTGSGELLVVYREGLTHAVSEDPHDGRIALIRSADGGESWSEPVIIMDGDDYDDRNAAIACLPGGRLVVCWDKWRPPLHRGAYYIVSDDEGHTWSDPVQLQPHPNVHTRSPAVALRDGCWLIPLAEGEGHEISAAFAVIVDPATGQSEMITMGTIADGVADEVCVTRAADEALVALVRSCTLPTLLQTRSTDEGRTWEPAWPSGIPSQYTPADLITLPDGLLVCSFSFRERRNERLVISRDHGRTWEVESSVDVFAGTMAVGGDRSYPASVLVDEATIGTVLYETRAYPEGGTIWFVTTPLVEFDRPPVTALYQADEQALAADLSLPLPPATCQVRLKYRFTGKFGPPPNRLEVGLVAGGETWWAGYQMGNTPDRSGLINAVDLRRERSTAAETLLQQEAVGAWYDDGNEHELVLTWSEDSLRLSLDHREQFAVPAFDLRVDSLVLRTVRAAVAVYELSAQTALEA